MVGRKGTIDYFPSKRTDAEPKYDWKKIGMVSGLITGMVLAMVGVYFWGRSSRSGNGIAFVPVIDGVIENDWEYADYKFVIYTDCNNSGDNIDSLNYLYLQDNGDNITIAIDMVSKQENDTTGEWTGLWMNVLDTAFGYNESVPWSMLFGFFEMPEYLDDGVECLIYDIENETVYSLLKDEDVVASQSNDIYEDQVEITSGELRTDGWVSPNDWDLTWTSDGDSCVISSEQQSIEADVKDQVLLNFSIDIQELFWMIPESSIPDLVDSMDNITLTLESFLVKQSYTNIYDWEYIDENLMEACNLTIEDNGTINDAQIIMDLGIHEYEVNKSALESGYLNFSINVYNHTLNPYKVDLWIDYMQFSFDYLSSFDTLYGVSTIEDFEFEFSFDSSPNSIVDHRTIEISIPKDEIELYDEDNPILNIMVEGGGLEINQNDYVYSYQFDEYINNARPLIRSYVFSAGTESYGDYDGTKYLQYWTPYTPFWSRNYLKLYS